MSPALQMNSFTTEPPEKPLFLQLKKMLFSILMCYHLAHRLLELFHVLFVFCVYLLVAKNLPASEEDSGDVGLIPGWDRYPEEGNGNPLKCFLPREFHEQRSLVDYNLWGCKELDATEHTHAH